MIAVCLCDVRVHLLEEQLRETEVKSAELLAEEQRRSRDMIVCRTTVWFSLVPVFVCFKASTVSTM